MKLEKTTRAAEILGLDLKRHLEMLREDPEGPLGLELAGKLACIGGVGLVVECVKELAEEFGLEALADEQLRGVVEGLRAEQLTERDEG
jgi:hypothetical protein